MLPLALILAATASAAAMAYGTQADWARFSHGLAVIMVARRLQWPLVAASLILCVALIALVIAGKRRAWWLIGLAPVLALFVQRFTAGPAVAFAVYDEPSFVAATEANFLGDDDYVVGLQFQDDYFAYPYSTLYHYPVVAQADHDRRMLLMWSPLANRATAVNVTRDLRARDLDVVSMPAGALLLYNMRIGQFVNGLTARAADGSAPFGFGQPIPTTKTTWRAWRAAHPETRVLAAPGGGTAGGPSSPLMPPLKMPPIRSEVPPDTPIALIATTQPAAAVLPGELSADPINVTAGDARVFVFRDPAGAPRAFERWIDVDLVPAFRTARGEGRKGAAFIDNYTETAWSPAGVAMDGELKGRKLTPVPVEEDLNWGVMKHWYPNLELHHRTMRPSR